MDAKLAEVEPNQYIRQFLLTNVNKGQRHEHVTSKVPLDIVGNAITKGIIASWPYDLNISRWTGPSLFIRERNQNIFR